MPKFLLKFIFIVLLSVAGLNTLCRAQYRIPLDSVAKITFISAVPWWNGPNYSKVEVAAEHGVWKIFQTELHTNRANDLSRKFLHLVAKKDISTLLKLISNADTVIRPALFKIDKKRILSEFDTLLPLLKPRQRNMIAKKIHSKGVLDSMVIDQVHRPESDMSSYIISIITKRGDTCEVSAYANYQIYGHLPWRIGKIKSYDPRISAIFDGIVSGSFNSYSVKRFYSQIVFWTYMRYFKTNLATDNLKEDFPVAYQSLTASFKPVIMGDNNHLYNLDPPRAIDSLYYMGGFRALGLPKYVNLYFNFKPVDTATLNSRIRYVDTIKRYFTKTNFLFKYLETHPAATLRFQPSYSAYNRDLNFRSISNTFTDISKYDLSEIQIISVVIEPNIRSRWLLLPDNTLLLCSYSNSNFTGVDGSVLKPYNKHAYAVCLHFDATGKLIKDYGTGQETPFFDN